MGCIQDPSEKTVSAYIKDVVPVTYYTHLQ